MTDFLNLIFEPLKDVFHTITQFLPNLLAMLVILIIGILVARVLRVVLVRFLTALKFDSWSDRMGMTTLMRKGDLWAKPSLALGSILYWIMIVVALMMGLSALKIQAVDNLVSQFFLYLPRAFSAVMILLVGYFAYGLRQQGGADRRGEQRISLRQAARRGDTAPVDGPGPGHGPGTAPGRTRHRARRLLDPLRRDRAGPRHLLRRGGIDAAKRMIERETVKKSTKETKDDIQHI